MRTLPLPPAKPEDTQRLPALGKTLPLYGAPAPAAAPPPEPAASAPATSPWIRTLRLEPYVAPSWEAEAEVHGRARTAPHPDAAPSSGLHVLPALPVVPVVPALPVVPVVPAPLMPAPELPAPVWPAPVFPAPVFPAPASPATSDDVRRVLGIDKPRRRRLGWKLAALAALLLLLAAAILALSTEAPPATYVTAPAKRAPVRASVIATGVLEAVTAVDVGSEVSGRVLELGVDENDTVELGQVLAVIDRAPLEAELEQATAHVAGADARVLQARASANEASVLAKRTVALREAGLSPQTELDRASTSRARAHAELAAAQAEAASARAALKLMQAKLERATIRSPIQGIVLSRNVELGQTITAGFQTPVLFRLAKDLTQLRLRAGVDEADVARIRVGNEASFTVEAHKERSFSSRVLTLANDSRTTQNVVTYRATLAVDNTAQLLRPGMTCTATIVTDVRENALVVPNSALRFQPEPEPETGEKALARPAAGATSKSPKVWVLSGGIPQPIAVKVGISDGEVTEILEGLTEQTAVIVDRDEAQ